MDWQTTIGFATLFAGRTEQWFDSNSTRCHHGPTSLGLYREHLLGEEEVGIYPVRSDGRCQWGCLDFDDANSYNKARAVQACAEWHGIRAWVERSRSKGYHVWFFCAGAMHARLVRDTGRALDLGAGTECDEINPKSTDHRKIVNCVRLPYSGAAAAGRMVMLDEQDQEMPLRDFVREAIGHRTSRVVLEHCARLSPPEHPPQDALSQVRKMLRSQTPGRGGETEGTIHLVYRGEMNVPAGTRDDTFWVLANYCKGMGLELDQARAKVLEVWDDQTEQYGYNVEEALKKVDRVYAGEERDR